MLGRSGDNRPVKHEIDCWLRDLGLPRHEHALRHIIGWAEREPQIRWLEVAGSFAWGGQDELSDLDLGVGIAEKHWPAALPLVRAAVESIGDVVEIWEHEIDEWGDRPHRRFFGQLRDGLQIDLVAMPAASRKGLPPTSLSLYDRDRILAQRWDPPSLTATGEQLRDWAFAGWVALADVDKYVRRGSTWEADARLHEARTMAWRLWAAASAAAYPDFGLTSALDEGPPAPAGMEQTVAALDVNEQLRAARALADVLDAVAARVNVDGDVELPTGLREWVRGRLASSGQTSNGQTPTGRSTLVAEN